MSDARPDAKMFSACPHCNEVVHLTPEQLNRRHGVLRCGACRRMFAAKLIDPARVRETADKLEVASRLQIADDEMRRQINPGNVDDILNRENPIAAIFWLIVCLSLAVLLVLQMRFFFVEQYAQDFRSRAWLTLFCQVAFCELPEQRDPSRLALTNTKVELHPEQPQAVRLTVRIANLAEFAQPWPNLQITLTDRMGRVVGRRTYSPPTYLARNQVNMLTAGEIGTAHFDLAHPHAKAVGFVVDIVTARSKTKVRSS